MRLNLLAGVANSAWTALVMLAVVPLYLKYLGIEAYGLIGFFATTQALLQLLDMGLAPTINREVARASASGNLSESGELLHTLAIIYWTVAGLIALGIFTLAPVIADYWLRSNTLSPQSVTHAVMLIGLVVACRWPVGLYQGAVIGAHRLAVSSAINIGMVSISSLGAVGVLAFISPSIEVFFVWQACVGLLHALVMRYAAWRIIGKHGGVRFNLEKFKQVWRFSAGMSSITITSLVLTQLDKLILSKILGLEEFGHYMIAVLLVSGLYVIITPTFNVIYPRFSACVAQGNITKLTELYRRGSRMLATVLFPVAMVISIFSEDLLLVWTGNSLIAQNTSEVLAVLAIGTAFNGVMFFPYALQLAYGKTWMPLTINLLSLIFQVPLIMYMVSSFGLLGGAFAWLILESTYLLLGPWLTHHYLLAGQRLASKWLLGDIGVPLVITLAIGSFAHYVKNESPYLNLVIGFFLALITFSITILLSPRLYAGLKVQSEIDKQ